MRKLFTIFGFCFAAATALIFAGCEDINEDDPKPVPMTFELSVSEIFDTSATATIQPSGDDFYYFDIVAASLVSGSGAAFNGIEAYAESVIDRLYSAGYDGWRSSLYRNQQKYVYSGLIEQTEYVLFAVAVDVETGDLTSEVASKTFTTGETPAVFTIDIADITPYGATVTVTPASDLKYYYSMVETSRVEGDKAEFNGIGDYARQMMDYLYNNTNWETLLYDGKSTRVFESGIAADSHCCVFAVGIDPVSREFTTKVETVEFDTAKLERPLFSFDVTDITASSATVTVTANNAGMKYLFEVGSKANLDGVFGGDAVKFMEYIIKETYAPQIGFNDVTWSSLLSWPGHKERATYTYLLTGDTDYVVFATGVDLAGNIFTEAETCEFKTSSVVPSNNSFYIEEYKGLVTVYVENNDPYVLGVFPKEDVDGKSEADLIDYVVNYYGGALRNFIYEGEQKFNYASKVDKFGDFVVVVFGYNGGATTGVTTYEYHFEGADRSTYTNLTGDFSYDANYNYGDYATAVYYGDFYGNGGGDWVVMVYGYDGLFQTEFVTEGLSTDKLVCDLDIDVDGLFTYPAGKAYGGILYDSGWGYDDYFGTWLIGGWMNDFSELDGNYDAAADSGVLKMALTDKYTDDWGYEYFNGGFECEFTDPKGHKVKYTYAGGEVMWTDANMYYSLSAASAAHQVNARVTLNEFSTLSKIEIREKIQSEVKSRAEARMKNSPKGARLLSMPEKAAVSPWVAKTAE